MRNQVGVPARFAMRVVRYSAVFVTALVGQLAFAAGTACAAQGASSPRSEPNSVTFGLLGPVGLIAVVLGIAGMTAGVVRQRKRARARQHDEAMLADAPTKVLLPVDKTPV